jgi:hypothetical protein
MNRADAMRVRAGKCGRGYFWVFCDDDCLTNFNPGSPPGSPITNESLVLDMLNAWGCAYCRHCGFIVVAPTNCNLHGESCPAWIWEQGQTAAEFAAEYGTATGPGVIFDDEWTQAENIASLRPHLSGQAVALELLWLSRGYADGEDDSH